MDRRSDLLVQPEVVAVVPDLRDLAVLESADVHRRERDRTAGRFHRAHLPRCVPVAVQRPTTKSSSPRTKSTVTRRSGKAARKSSAILFCPSGHGSAGVGRRAWRAEAAGG